MKQCDANPRFFHTFLHPEPNSAISDEAEAAKCTRQRIHQQALHRVAKVMMAWVQVPFCPFFSGETPQPMPKGQRPERTK